MNNGTTCEHGDCEKNHRQAKNESIWIETATLPNFPPLVADIEVDVVVIGAGITGLTAALDLVRAGKSVAVLEASKIGRGVTGYTTAHVTSIIDTRFQDLIKQFGGAKAKLVADSTTASIEKIAANVREHAIECDWHYVPGYLYSEHERDVAMLREEAHAGQQLGLTAEFTGDTGLPFATKGAVTFGHQAEFHPLKYIQGLAHAVTSAGGKIYEMTRVVKVTDDSPCVVTTDRAKVRAGAVIMATHTPITKMLLVQAKIEPYRSYVMGLRSSATLPAGIYWDTEHPYHYTRSYQTPAGQVLIVGGEDHKTGARTDAEQHYRDLACYIEERFPDAEIMYRWSAQVFEPIDMLPFIGRAPWQKNVYIATGYAGNGMTFGTIGGMLTAALILHGSHAWEKIYQPTRFTWSWTAIMRQLKISLEIGKHLFLDRLSRGDGGTMSDVARGEGKILQLQGKKVAVYKNTSGHITKLSPVCTHAGCIVAWNNAEKTWDCPCHGGRYSPEGNVINGPPIKDLTKVS